MPKSKVTRKWIMSAFDKVISVPYCDLQYLLKTRSPSYYTSGIYGWSADIYIIDFDTCIVTGYRPFGNIVPSYVINDIYNRAAAKISDPRELAILLNTYIKEVTKNV